MKKLIMIAGLLLILGSCYNDKYDKLYPVSPTVVCDTTTVSYATDIMPIINASCAVSGGCHNSDGNPTTGGLNFTIFAILQTQATQDLMINDINGTPGRGHNPMPLNLPKISQCDINKLTRWVNEGAPNN